MKIKRACALGVAVALAVPVSAAVAGNGDKVTGGGQVLFSDDDVKRSTIAFTAQGTVDDAKGQVQFIDRTAGAGQSQVKYHGVVDCVEVTGQYAEIGGYRKGTENLDRFILRVFDGGEPNQGNDAIQFDSETEDNFCGNDNDDEDPDFALAKGNAQVRDGDSSNPEQSGPMMSFKKALALAKLR